MSSQGSIKQIFGPVVDVSFDGGLPAIYEATYYQINFIPII